MELQDAALPLLNSVRGTIDQADGFKGCHVSLKANIKIALLVGAKPRGPGMNRSDLLKDNGSIFKAQALVIQENAHPDVKIVVVGNPANTNAAIIAEYATKIPKANITSLTRYLFYFLPCFSQARLDQNRALSQISGKLSVPVRDVKNIIIWGNHSST